MVIRTCAECLPCSGCGGTEEETRRPEGAIYVTIAVFPHSSGGSRGSIHVDVQVTGVLSGSPPGSPGRGMYAYLIIRSQGQSQCQRWLNVVSADIYYLDQIQQPF